MADFWDQFETIDEKHPQNSSDFWGQFEQSKNETPINTDIGVWKNTTISKAPKRNLLTDFRDCLKWVNHTRIAAYQEGKEQTETGALEFKDMFNKISPEEKQRLDFLDEKGSKGYEDYGINEPHNYYKKEFDPIIPRTQVGLKKGYVETLNMLPLMWETIKASGVGGAAGAIIGGGANAARAALTTKADIIPSLVQGALTGAHWGGRITGAMKIAELEAGLARHELKQINKDIEQKGGDPLTIQEINTLSLSVGAINAGLEMVGLEEVLKTVPGGDKILGYLKKKSLHELASDKTVRQQLRGVLAQYSKSVFAEVSTEMLQETTNIAAEHIAQKLGGIDCTPLEENVARVLDTGKATFGATMFLGGAGSVAKTATIMAKQGLSKKEAISRAKDMTPQAREELIAANFDTLIKSVDDIPSVKEVQERADLKNKYYTQLKNAGKADDEALQSADLVSGIVSKSAKEWGISLDEAEKKFAITIENMSNDEAIEQWRGDNQAALQGRIVFDPIQNIDEKLSEIYSEYEELGDEFSDDNTINKYKDTINVLEEIKSGLVSEENKQKAQALIEDYEQSDPKIARAIKTALENQDLIKQQTKEKDLKAFFQSAMMAGINPNQKVNIVNLTSNFKNNSKLSNKDLTNYIHSLIGKSFSTADNKAIINFIKSSKRQGKRNVYVPSHIANSSAPQHQTDKARKTSVRNIVDLIQNSVLIEKESNTKRNAKPDIDNYYRFYVPVQIGNDIYTVRLVAENKAKNNLFNIISGDLYDVVIDNKKPINPALNSQGAGSTGLSANNIIAQNSPNLNPSQITIKDMLKGVQDTQGQPYFQTAYTGSAAKYDVPSLDFIGTGEGAQAHGWGLYYAKGKDVAEGYRKNLSDTDGIGTEIKVDNKTYKKVAFNTYRNKDDLYESVDDYLREALNFIETKGSKKEALKYIQNQIDMNKNAGYFDEAAYYIRIKNALNEIKQAKITKYADDYEQLFKVDIPEDDVLLDENKKIKEQSKKVVEALKELCRNEGFNYMKLVSGFDKEMKPQTGKQIYSNLRNHIQFNNSEISDEESAKQASLLLNKYGIKGITYNGRQDGRCYVVFDDKAVKVLETYYQEENIKQPQEYDYIHNQETGEKIDIVMNRDIKVKEIEPQKISSKLPFEIAAKTAVNRRLILQNLNLVKGNKISVVNTNTNEKATISRDTIKKSISNVNKNVNYGDFIKILYNIENLYKNSQKILSYKDTKKDTDLIISRYANIANIDGKNYLLEFTLKDKGEIEIYALNALSNNKSVSNKHLSQKGSALDTDIYSIANIQSVFKSKIVQKYNNDYKNSKAKNNTYYQSENTNNEIEENINNARGLTYQRINFDGTIKDNFIILLKNKSDKSTLVHEFAHVYLTTLNNMARENERAREMLLNVNKWLRYDGVEYTTAQHEKFANGFVAYVKSGKAPTYGLKRAFENFRKWLNDLYDTIKESEEITLDEEGERVFDELLGGEARKEYLKKAQRIIEKAKHNANLRFDKEGTKTKIEQNLNDYLSEEDIQKNEYELDYILEEYKYAKDKTLPMMAYYDWLEGVHPYVQEEFNKKWEARTNEIERYEALSKFEQAKEDLKIYAAALKGRGDYSTQFAQYARQILKRLDFMGERDKEKIFGKLSEYNSFREIQANLDYVMDYAQTLSDVSERKQIAQDIEREVRQTVHEWKNGIKKTKYTYPANKLFTRLREINRMKREEIEYLYDSMANDEHEITYEADAVNDEDYYKVIEKMFIEFKYNGSYYNSTEFLKDLLDKIQGAKFSAKLARDEIDFERRMQQINLIDECARALDTHKGKVSKLEKAYRHAFNLNSALEMMFNKEVKNKFSLDYLYALKDGRVGRDRNEVLEKLARVFGYQGRFKNIQLFNKFIDMTKPEFEIRQRYTPDKVNGTYRITHTDKETGKTFTDRVVNMFNTGEHREWDPEPIKLSRMEVIYYYIQAKNPISYKMLTDMGDENTAPKGQFDKYEFDELLKNLTPQEQIIGDIIQLAAEKYYPELNKYHIKKYHTDLGKAVCYFPRKSETQDVKMLEMFNDYASLNTNQKFQKQRTAGPGVRISPANPLAVLFDHMEKANTLIVMGEQLDLMNSVFKNGDLKNKIKAIWGEETMQDFMQQVTSNLYSGQVSALSTAEQGIGSLMNNVIKSQIFYKPQVGLKQTLSFMNYGIGDEYVSASEWMKKFAQQTFSPKEWKNNIDYMMNIPYLKDRFSRGGSTDALKKQLEQRIFAKTSLFDGFFSVFVRLGDIGAIILGGKPYIECLKDKGYTEEQAIRIFIEKTVNDQQSSIPSTLSNIQRNASRQPLAKMFFAYQNTPWQYFRSACNSIIKFKQNPNKQTGLNMVKLTSIYLFVFPLMFNMASSLSPISALGGDTDDLKDDLWKSVIGGVTFVPLAGMFVNAVFSGLRGERASSGNWFDTSASKLGKIAKNINKGEITISDIFEAVALFGEGATGLPLSTMGTEAMGAIDMFTDSPAKGLIKMSGYTDYRARKVTGQEK